jgi:hypothetical protein
LLATGWLAAALLLSWGCADRRHLYRTTGVASQEALRRQAESRSAPSPRGLGGADAEIVTNNYHTTFRKGNASQGGGSAAAAVPGGETGLTPGAGETPPGAPGNIQLQAR